MSTRDQSDLPQHFTNFIIIIIFSNSSSSSRSSNSNSNITATTTIARTLDLDFVHRWTGSIWRVFSYHMSTKQHVRSRSSLIQSVQ